MLGEGGTGGVGVAGATPTSGSGITTGEGLATPVMVNTLTLGEGILTGLEAENRSTGLPEWREVKLILRPSGRIRVFRSPGLSTPVRRDVLPFPFAR